jgi:uncharacterized protein (TIGR01319 family)
METIYTPLGVMYYQRGKDLTDVKYIIGTGGIILYGEYPEAILSKVFFDPAKPVELRPKQAELMLDYDYLLSAMGLLSFDHPEVALRIMKKRIGLIK